MPEGAGGSTPGGCLRGSTDLHSPWCQNAEQRGTEPTFEFKAEKVAKEFGDGHTYYGVAEYDPESMTWGIQGHHQFATTKVIWREDVP